MKPCLAPWHTLTIKPNGDVVPDSTFTGSFGNINTHSLKEMWDSPTAKELREAQLDNRMPEGCRICDKKFQATGRSRRTYFDDNIRKHLPEEESYHHDYPQIIYLDVNFSNKCNLKCRMCSGHVSTAWIKEELELNKIQKSYKRHFHPSYRVIELEKFKRFFNDAKAFKDLKFVALRGGEPLLEELNYLLLEYLIEIGIAKNISLDISTNGTLFDPRLKKLLAHFKSTELYISLEGTDRVYEYIRGDTSFTFKQLEENIKLFRELDNTTLIFAVTIMSYNIFEINKIWDWYIENKQEGDEISFSNLVVNPAYLDYRILPKELREKAASKLTEREYPGDNYYSGKRWIGDIGIDGLKRTLREDSIPNSEILLKQFKDFTNDIDKLRNCSIIDYIDDLKEIF